MKLGRLILPLIALGGIAGGAYYAVHSNATNVVQAETPPSAGMPPAARPASLPPSSEYEQSISGTGLIEANTRNIEVGSHLSGVATEMLVAEGDLVKQGTPLFRLDDRAAKTDIATAESDVAMARAQLNASQVTLADQQDQLQRVSGLKAGFAVTIDRVSRLRFAAREAEQNVEVAKASLNSAEAKLQAAKTTLAKLTVTAPVSGRILKVNIRAGEYIQAGSATAPLIMGNDTPLHVRVSLDENDLWRFDKEAKATGALRSNRDIKFPLKFVRIEPYVSPKMSLTGATSERVDTRVMDVVYRIEPTDSPIYIGQQVDVFIEAKGKPAAKSAMPGAAQTPPATGVLPPTLPAHAAPPETPAGN